METGAIRSTGKVCEQIIEDSNVLGVWCGGEGICSFVS